jgi:hypothetical protein
MLGALLILRNEAWVKAHAVAELEIKCILLEEL